MSPELRDHIDAILDAYSGVPDNEANQPLALTITVLELRELVGLDAASSEGGKK